MINKHKVDVIVKYFYPVAAGIETNILETYSPLTKRGWDVSIHTSKDTLTEKNVLVSSEKIRGLKIIRYNFSWYSYFPKINWSSTDLVCLHNFNVMPHGWILLYALIRNILGLKTAPIIVTPHGGFNPEWRIFSIPISFAKKIYHYSVGTLLLNYSASGIRAVSDWEKEEMLKVGVNKKLVTVISNGVEDEAFKKSKVHISKAIKNIVRKHKHYLIQIGRIYMIKNYETTINALKLLPKSIHYLIVGPVGDDKYFAKLKDFISKNNLSNRVEFVGVVRGQDKYYLIKKSLLMVHMALWESFCNVVHEAMSQGKVVIVANNTALPYLIKDKKNGFVIDTHDFLELAKKIKYVFTNPRSDLIKRIRIENINFAKDHSWSKVSKKMEKFYLSKIL